MHQRRQQQKLKSANAGRAIPPPSRRRLLHESYLAKWRTWDWSKQNVELAAEQGLSHERIRQIRRMLGVRRSPCHHLRRTTVQAMQWAKDNLGKLKGLTFDEIQVRGGLKVGRGGLFHRFLKARNILRDGRRNRKHPWDRMNFQLPSGELERIWKTPLNMAASYRCRKRLGPPRWTLKRGLQFLKRRGQLGAYLRAVKAEERKARRYSVPA